MIQVSLAGPLSRDSVREFRANKRIELMTIRSDEKRNRTVEVANPNLGGAGVEVECAFFADLGGRIRGRNNLDANVRGACEGNRVLVNFGET